MDHAAVQLGAAAGLGELHLQIRVVRALQGQFNAVAIAEVQAELLHLLHLDLQAVEASHALAPVGLDLELLGGTPGCPLVLEGEHRDQPLLQAVAAMHKTHVVLAGVEHRSVLRHHQLPLHPLVAKVSEGHTHLAVVVSSMRAEDMAAAGSVLVPVAPYRRGRSLIEQKAVIGGDHKVAHACCA